MLNCSSLIYIYNNLQEDKDVIQTLEDTWKEFEQCLAMGEEFVKAQTPVKAQGLQESISVSVGSQLIS